MTRRERKLQVQQVLNEAFEGIDPNDDSARAEAVRNLCPCRGEWGCFFVEVHLRRLPRSQSLCQEGSAARC